MPTCSSRCCGGYCTINDLGEHFGLCPKCFIALSAEDIAKLRGESVPESAPQRVVTYTIPARPGFFARVVSFTVGSLLGGIGAALLMKFVAWKFAG